MTPKRVGRIVVAVGGPVAIAALIVTAGASARTATPFAGTRHVLPGSHPSWTAVAPQTTVVPANIANSPVAISQPRLTPYLRLQFRHNLRRDLSGAG